jgi:ubiquinone/menaquinone biosynthesis C-methylase UbiE
MFDDYFCIFPWEILPKNAVGFDAGCGSGRWAKLVAPRVGKLICVDASIEALEIAKKNLKDQKNCEFYHSSIDEMPIAPSSMDFGYSLGVLHHVPDTQSGIQKCVEKLKPGAPFLVYLYYAFDNRPFWYRATWKISDWFRWLISKLPAKCKQILAEVIATFVYFPLARTAYILEKMGFNVFHFPLSIYRDKSFYTMRTDALDRFGTRIEHKFTRSEIEQMLIKAGLEDIRFSDKMPF